MRFSPLRTVILLAAMLLFHAAATSQESVVSPQSIVVAGVGQAKAPADTAMIIATVHGSAEIASEARTIYVDNRRRAIEAIEAMGLENLTIEGAGPSLKSAQDPEAAQQMMMGNEVAPTSEVTVSERLTLKLTGLQEMSTDTLMQTILDLIDEAKDAGLIIGEGGASNIFEMQMGMGGQTALVTFGINDKEELTENAYANAIADARSKAERIARLSGRTLGGISHVSEASNASSNPSLMGAIYGIEDNEATAPATGPTTDAFGPVQLTVSLEVWFELQ